ncbi:hypothetical protein, partial [Brevibacillus borstelensis]|uniref:hypothetical protein n=1 Tax=Brevibacillus borstelensis TaxID=45462 RepID=UPI001D09EAD7
GLVTEKLLQVGVKSFFYAQKTLLLKGLDLCKRLNQKYNFFQFAKFQQGILAPKRLMAFTAIDIHSLCIWETGQRSIFLLIP